MVGMRETADEEAINQSQRSDSANLTDLKPEKYMVWSNKEILRYCGPEFDEHLTWLSVGWVLMWHKTSVHTSEKQLSIYHSDLCKGKFDPAT